MPRQPAALFCSLVVLCACWPAVVVFVLATCAVMFVLLLLFVVLALLPGIALLVFMCC